MADFTDIRQALAARAATVAGIREATADLLSGVGELPAVKVTHVSEARTTERGPGYELRDLTVKGVLLCAKAADIGRAQATVEDLCELLTVAHRTTVLLGLAGYVQDSSLESWSLVETSFGGLDLPGADLTYRVVIREAVTRTA